MSVSLGPSPVADAFGSVRKNLQTQSKRMRWRNDPALWAWERLGVHLWSVQKEIGESVRDNKRTAVAACHGPGKSMLAAVLSCWWIDTHPLGDAIVMSTAPTYPQVNKILWEEMRKLHRRARERGNPLPGRITQGDEWKLDNGEIVGFGRKPADGDTHAFQGIHRSEGVFVVIDESCGVPEEIWTGAEAVTTTADCRIMAIGNPDDRNTEFGNVFLKDKYASLWNRIKIPASATPNFTGEEVPPLLNKVLISQQWAEDARQRWGEDDPRYIAKVLADFPDVSTSSLFGPDLLAKVFVGEDEGGTKNSQPTHRPVQLGVDVARFGQDNNVVCSYVGSVAKVEDVWGNTDTVSSAQRVLSIAEEIRARLSAPSVDIRVDAVGLGAGVVDTLAARRVTLEHLGQEVWFTVKEMYGSAGVPKDMGGAVGGYGNARAYWYDQTKLNMRNGSIKVLTGQVSEEIEDQLRSELGMIFYKYKNGRLYILSKEEMRQQYGKSPDCADALVYASAPVYSGPETGDTFSEKADTVLKQLQLENQLEFRETRISPF